MKIHLNINGKLMEDLYVTHPDGQLAYFPKNGKMYKQCIATKGTPCTIIGIIKAGKVRIRTKSIDNQIIEGDELMNKIKIEG